MTDLFEVIAEDEDFLVINKPAGLVCHPTKGDVYSSLISRVRLYLGEASSPHLINRLDRETSGIVIVAKTTETAARIRKLWESRAVRKEYLAIVHGQPAQTAFTIFAPLGKDSHSEISIKDTVVLEGAASETQASVLKNFARNGKNFALVRVTPLTGRKHQIRIHLAYMGHPIVGDKMYGGDEQLYLSFVKGLLTDEQKTRLMTENHALHAGVLSFSWQGAERRYSCPPEPWFREFAGMD